MQAVPGLAAAALLLGMLLAGCLSAPGGPPVVLEAPPEESNSIEWWSDAAGPLLIGVDYVSEPDANCTIEFRAQGVADRLMPVIAGVLDEPVQDEGPRRADFFVDTNARSTDLTNHVTVLGADTPLVAVDDREFWANWAVNVSGTFQSTGKGTIWYLIPHLEHHGEPSNPRNSHEAYAVAFLGNETARLSFSCEGPWSSPGVRHAREAVLIAHAPETGLLHARVQPSLTLLYAGVGNAVEWESVGNTSFYGLISGDPSKIVVAELHHPEGTERWFGLPTSYMGIFGDVHFSHRGPPGDYTLSYSGVGSGIFETYAVAVLE